MAAATKTKPNQTSAGNGAGNNANHAENGVRAGRSRLKLWPLADGLIVGSVAAATLRSIGWFAGLFLAFAFVQAARTVAVSDVPINVALESLALQLPRIVLFTIPASLLYGTVATFTEMSSRGEVTALMCGGLSLPRMLRAPLIFAALLTLLAFWLQEVVVPDFELRKSNLTARAAVALLQTQKFKPLVDIGDDGKLKRIVQAEKFDIPAKMVTKPVILLFRPDGTVETEIKAQSAAWDAKSKSWVFTNGSMRTPVEKGETRTVLNEYPRFIVQTDQMPAPDKFDEGEKSARDQLARQNYEMISWRQLAAHRAEERARLAALSGPQQREVRKEIRRETYGIHDKFATPLVVMAMLLIGAPLGVRPQRTASPGLAMGISLIVILGYYLLWTFCTQWGKGGGQWPVFAAYLPLLVVALVGGVLLARKSGTP